MPIYKCQKCGRIENISIYDIPKQFCPECDLIITDGRYEKNCGGITLFATFGQNLGHQLYKEVLIRYYEEQNPNEDVIVLSDLQTLALKVNGVNNTICNLGLSPRDVKKIFYAEISQIANIPKDKRVIYYHVAHEVTKLAKMGYYPQWYEFEKPDVDLSEPYIVLHLRNVHGNPEKNVSDYEAEKIFGMLENYKVFIVGNDMPYYQLEPDYDFINLRGRNITLSNIAYLLRHENCIAMIGKDSGIAHLAAAAKCRNIIAYGYKNKYWMPKAKRGIKTFLLTNNGFEDFIEYLHKFLRGWECHHKYVLNAGSESVIPKRTSLKKSTNVIPNLQTA